MGAEDGHPNRPEKRAISPIQGRDNEGTYLIHESRDPRGRKRGRPEALTDSLPKVMVPVWKAGHRISRMLPGAGAEIFY